jgi:hypothetical protein
VNICINFGDLKKFSTVNTCEVRAIEGVSNLLLLPCNIADIGSIFNE